MPSNLHYLSKNILVTVVTVVTMPMPQGFLLSPVSGDNRSKSGDVPGIFLRRRLAVLPNSLTAGGSSLESVTADRPQAPRHAVHFELATTADFEVKG